LSTLEPAARIVIVSADSRFAASSNDALVRVELSKKTLATVRPRSVGTFFTSRSITDSKPWAASRMRSTPARSRSCTASR
jgi:hypothetical protein